MDCLVLADGTRVDAGKIVNSGIDGFIIRAGPHVLKIPKLYGRLFPDGTVQPSEENRFYVDDLENEKQVYKRLHNILGIARCIDCTQNGILLEYYSNGSLETSMKKHNEPQRSVKHAWIGQITDIIARCHERRVLLYDIALRNIVLTNEHEIRLIDFANSVLLPEDVDVSQAAVGGYSMAVELLHLANVIYSVMSWRKFSVDCAMESEWPDTSGMPVFGIQEWDVLIFKCWNKQYSSIVDLHRDLQLCLAPLTRSQYAQISSISCLSTKVA